MCFGNNQTTQTTNSTQTTTQPQYIQDASRASVAAGQNLLNTPFKEYTGELTAGTTADQSASYDQVRALAGSSNPYLSDIEGLYNKFANSGAQTVAAPSVLGGGYDASKGSIQDYMNPYVSGVLQPQLQELDRSWDAQKKAINAGATMAGAFGDARHGVADAATGRNYQIARDNTVKAGYGAAFDKASGLRSQDVSNLINTGTTNAGLAETALQRSITGGTALRDLDKYTTGRSLDLANALNVAGTQQQKTQQAADTAKYEEFLKERGYPAEQAKAFAAILGAQPNQATVTGTSTTQQPNNSGFGMLGTLMGAALAPFTGGASLLPGVLSGITGGLSRGNIGGTGGGLGGLY